jgi:outer membrane murein-binding lipoprotein Lpp
LKNYKIGVIIFFLLLLTGCTSNNEINSVDLEDYETQIKVLKSENESLKEQIQKLNGDYSVYLQQADKTSRQIMKLIGERNMDHLKAEYNAEFEVSDDKIFFTSANNLNSAGFPFEQAILPMFIANLNIQSEVIEIGYYLDDLKKRERYLVTFVYDKDGNFKYIYIGDN